MSAAPANLGARLVRYGDPSAIEVVELPIPEAGPGEVRVKVLASSVQFTDTVIRRHRYPHVPARPPFVLGYDVVGEVDRIGPDVRDLAIGDRVADMTVIGSNTRYRTLRADRVTRVPEGVDAAEAATLVLSWMTAHQLLHRFAEARRGQRVLVIGANGAVGQALVTLGRLAGLEVWGAASAAHVDAVRARGATPVDHRRDDYARLVAGGFDRVLDGVGEDGYRRAWAAVGRGGRLCAYGFTAGVDRPRLTITAWIARLYVWSALSRDRRAGFYSINAMRARHPQWFREDLAGLFQLLRRRAIDPKVAERIDFDGVRDAHRRLEAGGLEGKIVLLPNGQSRGREPSR